MKEKKSFYNPACILNSRIWSGFLQVKNFWVQLFFSWILQIGQNWIVIIIVWFHVERSKEIIIIKLRLVTNNM